MFISCSEQVNTHILLIYSLYSLASWKYFLKLNNQEKQGHQMLQISRNPKDYPTETSQTRVSNRNTVFYAHSHHEYPDVLMTIWSATRILAQELLKTTLKPIQSINQTIHFWQEVECIKL